MGGSYQQEVDLLTLFKDVCSDYVQMCTVPAAAAQPDRPGDPDRRQPSTPRPASSSRPTCSTWSTRRPGTRSNRCRPASALRRPTVDARTRPRSAGRGGPAQRRARRSRCWSARAPAAASTELTEVADLLGAGAAKALLGKDVLPDDLPWVTGSIGLLGTTASYELMMGCDTLLTVGSNFPYTQFLPDLDQARAVQIDRSGKWIGMRYPYELNLVGDAKATLRALIPLLQRKTDRAWREQIEADVADWWQTVERAGDDRRRPGQPDADLPRAVPAAARRTRSSPPTPAAPRTGTPGT